MGDWNLFKITQINTWATYQKSMKLRKTAILGTAHTLWKLLMEKYKTYFTGEITSRV